jgi:hypothetical protein
LSLKKLFAAILQTENKETLMAIQDLLKIEEQVDFWDQLSEADQEAINKGIKQLDEGKSKGIEFVEGFVKEKTFLSKI